MVATASLACLSEQPIAGLGNDRAVQLRSFLRGKFQAASQLEAIVRADNLLLSFRCPRGQPINRDSRGGDNDAPASLDFAPLDHCPMIR
jgi:hypothetical protein